MNVKVFNKRVNNPAEKYFILKCVKIAFQIRLTEAKVSMCLKFQRLCVLFNIVVCYDNGIVLSLSEIK